MKEQLTVIYFASGEKETLNKLKEATQALQIIEVYADTLKERNEKIGECLNNIAGKYFTVVDEGDTWPENLFDKIIAFGSNNLEQEEEQESEQEEEQESELVQEEEQTSEQEESETELEEIETVLEEEQEPVLISCKKSLNKKVLDAASRGCQFIPKNTRKRGLIDLNTNVYQIPVTLNGTFVLNTKEVKDLWQDKGIESEKNFLLRVLLLNLEYYRFGNLNYIYVEPTDCHYELYTGVFYKEWYIEAIDEFMLPLLEDAKNQYGYVPKFLQYFTMYFMMCRLNANVDNRNKHILEGEEAANYKDYFRKLLLYVDDDIIIHGRDEQNYYSKDINLIRMFLQIKNNNYNLDFKYMYNGRKLFLTYDRYCLYSVNSLRVNVLFIEYDNEKWEMDLSVPSYFQRSKVNYYVKADGILYPVQYNEQYSLTKYFGQSAYKRIYFHASVPIKQNVKEQKIQFVMEFENKRYVIAPEYKSHTSRLTGAYKYAYWRFNKFIAFHNKNTIYIRQAKPWYTAYREIRSLMQMLKSKTPGIRNRGLLRIAYHALKPIYGKKRIWMFYDKIYKGGDSSEYLFKYASQFDDGIDKYYLIDKDCPDRKRLEKEGYKPLIRGSWKHRLIFLYADMMIVSNSTVFAFNDQGMPMSAYIRDLAKFHVVCVQHGMSVQKIAIAQRRLRDNTRLYFCASKYEIENLSKPVYDYVGYDALRLTGVPRYDGLINDDKKVILISPTWRMQSAMLVSKNEGVQRDYNPNFKSTDYYRVFNSLINDERLIEAAKKYGYRIAYVLHPIVSPQAKDFDKNEYVDIIPATGDMSYEKVFRESSLMVTDFSGIQFDFAYMRKPLVYLHHKDIPQHYEEGTFHYDTMAFGEICHDNDELIDLLCDYMKNGCKMKDEYRRRADDFFEFDDHNNCQRIYDEMIKYQKKVDRVNKIC